MGREIHAELHHDGTTVLAANLSWKALRPDALAQAPEGCLLLHQDFTEACCQDFAAVALELARRTGVDSAPVVSEHGGAFTSMPSYARRPHRIEAVTSALSPHGGDTALHEAAQELFTDLTTQFGLSP